MSRVGHSAARAAFLLLVLANLLYFVWAAGYLGGGSEGREPERLSAQLQPDLLNVTVRADKAADRAEGLPPKAATEVAEGPEAKPVPGGEAAARAADIVCRRIGPIANTDADRLAAAFRDKGAKVSDTVTADGNIYWVHVPSAEASGKLVADLKHAGVTDFFIATEGPNKGAISLGLFHREQAAKDLQQRLVKKGIKPVKIDVKPRKTDKVTLEIRAPADLIDGEIAGRNFPAAACAAE